MRKSELYGYIGTVVSGIIILLILFFVILPGLKTAEDDGIMISFGDAVEGGGNTDATTQMMIPEASAPRAQIKEELITQTEKSVAINETRKKNEPTQSNADERYRKEQQASQQADELIGGSFGNSTNAGSGSTSGAQSAGNPVGSGTSGGNSWSLNGRNLLGTIPTPAYNQNVEGYITVDIRVDASGNVISTSVKKATISDPSLRNAALTAAKRTRFSSGSGTAVGTITYNFKLR